MNERDRERLLGKLNRPARTVGTQLPDEIEVGGTAFDPVQFIFECEDLEPVTESASKEIDEVKSSLERERLDRKQRLRTADISVEEGERIVEEVVGLDRAITALESVDGPEFAERERQNKLQSARELMSLVRQRPD